MRFTDLSGNRVIADLGTLSLRLRESHSAQDTARLIRESFGAAYGPAALLMLATRGLPRGAYLVLRFSPDYLRWGEDDEPPSHDQLPLHRDGVIGKIIDTPEPKLVDDIDWSTDPYFHESLAGYGSLMAIPVAGGHLRTSWAILMKRSPDRFAALDLEGSMLRSVLAASLIESRELAGELAQLNHRIEAEMREVGELQRSLLPDPLPQIPGLKLAASFEPSGRAGGDMYDMFPLDLSGGPSGQWCIFIGDASGHGIAAAVVIAIIQSILHAHPNTIEGPADLLSYTNQQLCRKNLHGFVTAFLAFYDPGGKRLAYSSAGHPPALIKAADDGKVRRLSQAVGCPLGIDDRQTFLQAHLQLFKGDTLLLYTDGITEARGTDRQLLEIERLESAFGESEYEPSVSIQRLCSMIRDYQSSSMPLDDQTMVVLELT